MTIDLEAIAREAGIEPRGSDFDRETGLWDEDADLHISGQDGVSLQFLRAFANAVLEAAALECDLQRGDRLNSADLCANAVRALKVKP